MIFNTKQLADKNIEALKGLSLAKQICFVSFEDNAASSAFMAIKTKVAQKIGITADIKRFDAQTSKEAIAFIQTLSGYDGIVVQLPMPPFLEVQEILNSIPAPYDIDMLSEESKRLFIQKQTERMPPVAWAVHAILEANGISLKEKKIVIVGKGKLVGEPVALSLDCIAIPYDAIDIDTPQDLKKELLMQADIIISGIGVPHHIIPSMVKENAVLIDAGTSEAGGKLVGDIDPACAETAMLYTPVPGGVGPLTVIGLFQNLSKK